MILLSSPSFSIHGTSFALTTTEGSLSRTGIYRNWRPKMKRHVLITAFISFFLFSAQAQQAENSTLDNIRSCDQELNLCLDKIKAIAIAEKTAGVVQKINDEFKGKFKEFQRDYKEVTKNGSIQDLANKTDEQLREFYAAYNRIKEQCKNLLASIVDESETNPHVIDGKIVSLPREFIAAGFGFEDIRHIYDDKYTLMTPQGEAVTTQVEVDRLKSKQGVVVPASEITISLPTDTKFKAIYYKDGKYVIEFENGYQDIYEINGSQLIGTFKTPVSSETRTYTYVSPDQRIQEYIERAQERNRESSSHLGLASYEYDKSTQTLTTRGIDHKILNVEHLNFPPGVEMKVHDDGHHLIFRDTVRGLFFGSSFLEGSGGSVGIVSAYAVKPLDNEDPKAKPFYMKTTSFGNDRGVSGGSDTAQSVIDTHFDAVRYRDLNALEPQILSINNRQYNVRGPDRMGKYRFLSSSGQSSLYVDPKSQAVEFGANWNNTAKVISGSLSDGFLIVQEGLYGSAGDEVRRLKIDFSQPGSNGQYTVEELK